MKSIITAADLNRILTQMLRTAIFILCPKTGVIPIFIKK